MFNKFCNFLIDEDLLSKWVKMLKMSGNRGSIFSSFANDSLDKFLQFSLKLRNELLLLAIKDEINKAIHKEKSEEVSLPYVVGCIIFSSKKV